MNDYIIGDDGDKERLCEHGIGHSQHGVHTCDGCCGKPKFFTKGNDLRLDDPEPTAKATVTSQQGSTIEDKLNKLFEEYFPIGTATANDRKDDDKALLLTQVMEYRRNKFKQEIQAIITTETTKPDVEQLLDELGTDFKKLTLHSNGRWTADLRYKDKNAERHGCWGNTPVEALQKAAALQKEQK